jgi:hypothetical protein
MAETFGRLCARPGSVNKHNIFCKNDHLGSRNSNSLINITNITFHFTIRVSYRFIV